MINFVQQYGALVGSLIASGVALFLGGGGGRWLISYFFKPKLKIKGNIIRFRQNHYQWRLSILNDGNEVAEQVQADVIAIYDGGLKRPNFVHMPLLWTHLGNEARDILPKQEAFLDVIEQHHIIRNELYGTVNLSTRFGGGIDDFRQIWPNPKITTLELVFYEKRTGNFKMKIEILWKSGTNLNARIKGKSWHLKNFSR